MKFLDNPPRFLFFTGKGGVGKTSIACASAITLARAGRQVLLVSTDPASNLDQVLGDNRPASADSRVFGLVAVDNLIGVATMRCGPTPSPLR